MNKQYVLPVLSRFATLGSRICIAAILVLLGIRPLLAATEIKNGPKPACGEWNFALAKVWETSKAGDNTFQNISSLRVDDDGRVFAFDRVLGQFLVFNPEGSFLYSFGKIGTEKGQYSMVANFFLVGRLVLVDTGGTLHFFFKDGTYSHTVELGGLFFVRATLDEDHLLFVKADESRSRTVDFLSLYTVSKDEWATLAEVPKDNPINLSSGTSFVAFRDYSLMPRLIVKVDGENLFRGMNDQYLIQKTDLNGKPILTFSIEGKEPREVTAEFKRQRFANYMSQGERFSAEMLDQLVKELPSRCPYFDGIRTDENGLIYVSLVNLNNPGAREIDIFSPAGNYLYHALLRLPAGYEMASPPHFKGNALVVFANTTAGTAKLVKFTFQKPENKKN